MITAIRVQGVGISAFGSLLTGGCSAFPRNAVGFVHALQRKLASRGETLGEYRRVAVGVEDYRLHKGEKNPTMPKMALSKPWNGRGDIARSVLDYELKCNATITLLIMSDTVADTDALRTALSATVPTMRFGGGSLFVRGEFVSIAEGNDGDALNAAIRSVRAGRTHFMVSRDDLIREGQEFDSFVAALALHEVGVADDASDDDSASADQSDRLDSENPPADAEDADGEAEKQVKRTWRRSSDNCGWVVPLERGYQAISPPVVGRPGARDPNVPTILATPVIGLGEFVTAKRFRADLNYKGFWQSRSDRENGFFLFSATSFNS